MKTKTVILSGGKAMRMHIGNDLEQYRLDTLYTKEPETIAWIDSFADDAVLFDVGANIGIYSIHCALRHPTSTVYAFEPVFSNYARLIENIALNGLTNIVALPIALAASHGVEKLYIPDTRVGNSGAQICMPVDERGTDFLPVLTQDVLTLPAYALRMLYGTNQPDHIKIDVDGHESDVLLGALGILPGCESVLIEVNRNQQVINTLMRQHGFTQANEFNSHPEHSRNRRGGFPENIIYTR